MIMTATEFSEANLKAFINALGMDAYTALANIYTSANDPVAEDLKNALVISLDKVPTKDVANKVWENKEKYHLDLYHAQKLAIKRLIELMQKYSSIMYKPEETFESMNVDDVPSTADPTHWAIEYTPNDNAYGKIAACPVDKMLKIYHSDSTRNVWFTYTFKYPRTHVYSTDGVENVISVQFRIYSAANDDGYSYIELREGSLSWLWLRFAHNGDTYGLGNVYYHLATGGALPSSGWIDSGLTFIYDGYNEGSPTYGNTNTIYIKLVAANQFKLKIDKGPLNLGVWGSTITNTSSYTNAIMKLGFHSRLTVTSIDDFSAYTLNEDISTHVSPIGLWADPFAATFIASNDIAGGQRGKLTTSSTVGIVNLYMTGYDTPWNSGNYPATLGIRIRVTSYSGWPQFAFGRSPGPPQIFFNPDHSLTFTNGTDTINVGTWYTNMDYDFIITFVDATHSKITLDGVDYTMNPLYEHYNGCKVVAATFNPNTVYIDNIEPSWLVGSAVAQLAHFDDISINTHTSITLDPHEKKPNISALYLQKMKNGMHHWAIDFDVVKTAVMP
jgi:hypothetical protein